MDATCDGITGSIYLSLPQTSQSQKVPIKLSQGLQKVSLPVMTFTEKDEIKPWWPNGYGKPNLYALKVKKPVIWGAMFLNQPFFSVMYLFGNRSIDFNWFSFLFYASIFGIQILRYSLVILTQLWTTQPSGTFLLAVIAFNGDEDTPAIQVKQLNHPT